MAKELVMKCPFCGKADINVINIPVVLTFKHGTHGGSKPAAARSAEQTLVKDDNCLSCGKPKKELEKAFKNGVTKKVTLEEHKKRIERFKKQGLPTMR